MSQRRIRSLGLFHATSGIQCPNALPPDDLEAPTSSWAQQWCPSRARSCLGAGLATRPTLSVAALFLLIALASGQIQAASVTSSGAKCDGSSDDTLALQNAFNSVKSGGTLEFPSGTTCIVTGRIKIHDANGYTVDGNGATIKVKDGTPKANGPFIELRRNSNVIWNDITVDGNRENRPCPAAGSGDQSYVYHNVVVSATTDFVFDRVNSNDSCLDGFYIIGNTTGGEDTTTYSRRGTFLDVSALRNRRQGISIINAYELDIIGGSYSFTDGDWPMTGIDIEPNRSSAKPGVKGVTIRGALFEGNRGEAGLLISSTGEPEGIVVEDNHFKNNTVAGIRNGAKNVTIRRNLFEGTDMDPDLLRHDGSEMPSVYFGGVSIQNDLGFGARVVDNVFRDIHNHSSGVVYVRALWVSGVGTVSGNCFEDIKAPAVRNEEPESYTVADNEVDPPGGCADPRTQAEGEPDLPEIPDEGPFTGPGPVACDLLDASTQVPRGFAGPYNLFSPAKEVVIKVACGPVSDAQVEVGSGQNDLLIYKTGYEWTGSAWRSFQLDGATPLHGWFVGSADAQLFMSRESLEDNNFVAVFMCHLVSGAWKCGCRDSSCTAPAWSLQMFRMQLPQD